MNQADLMRIRNSFVKVADILKLIEADSCMDKRSAAEFLCLSVSTIEKLLHEIPHFKVGSKVLFLRSELLEWINQHRRVAVDPLSEDREAARIVDELAAKLRHTK